MTTYYAAVPRGYMTPSHSKNKDSQASFRHLHVRLLHEFCGLRNFIRCILRNVPHLIFRKLHVFEIPHSAKYTFPSDIVVFPWVLYALSFPDSRECATDRQTHGRTDTAWSAASNQTWNNRENVFCT